MKSDDEEVLSIKRGRPPRGGRGLKFPPVVGIHLLKVVAPLAGGVD